MNLGATFILIGLIGTIIANKLSVTNVRLPLVSRSHKIYYTVKAYNGQYNWISSNPDVLRVEYSNNVDESECKIILNTNQPYQQSVNIQAINIRNNEKLNVEATISAIKSIEIRTRDKFIELDSIEELRVEGYDADRNTFSTLDGVSLVWKIDNQMLQVLTYHQANIKQDQFKNLSQSDLILVKGIKTGQTKVSVIYSHGETQRADIYAQTELKICENIQIYPFLRQINVPTHSTYKFGLFILQKAKQQASEIQLPNHNYLWESNLQMNENQLITATPLFGEKVKVKSKLYDHPETSLFVNVIEPQSISVKFLEEKYKNSNLYFHPMNHEISTEYLLKNTSYLIVPIFLGKNGEEIRTQDRFVISTVPAAHINDLIRSEQDSVELTLSNGNFQKTVNLKFVNPLSWRKLGPQNELNVPAGEVISLADAQGGSGYVQLGSKSLYSRVIDDKIHFDMEGEEWMEIRDYNNHEITLTFKARIFNPAGLYIFEEKKEMYIEQSEFIYFGAYGYLNQQKYNYNYCNSLNLKITGNIDINITDVDNPQIDQVCVGYNARPRRLGRQTIEISSFSFQEKMEIFGISYLTTPYKIVFMSLNSKFELPINGGPQDWDGQQTKPQQLSCSGETKTNTILVSRGNKADKQLKYPKQAKLSILQYCQQPSELRIMHRNKIITWINGKIPQNFQVVGVDQQGNQFVTIEGLRIELEPIPPLEIINQQLVIKSKAQKVQLYVKSRYQTENMISTVKHIKTLNELHVYYELSIKSVELIIGEKNQIQIFDGSGDFSCFVDSQPVSCTNREIFIDPKNLQYSLKIIDNVMQIERDYQLSTKRLNIVRVYLPKQYLLVGQIYDLDVIIHDRQLNNEEYDKFQLSQSNDQVELVKNDKSIQLKALKKGHVQISFTYKNVESNTLMFYNFNPYKFDPIYVQVNCVTDVPLPPLINTLEYRVISNYSFLTTQIFGHNIRFFAQDTFDKEFYLDIEITNQKESVQITKIRTFLVKPNKVQILYGNRAVQQGAQIKLISQLFYNDVKLQAAICTLNYKWQLADSLILEKNEFFIDITITKSQVIKLEVGSLQSEVWIDVIKDKIPMQIFPNQQSIWQGPILLPQFSEYKFVPNAKVITGNQIALKFDSIFTYEQSQVVQTVEYNNQLIFFLIQQPYQIYTISKVFLKKQDIITLDLFLLNQDGRAFERVLNPNFQIFIVYRPIVEVSVNQYTLTIKGLFESGQSILKVVYQNIEDYIFVNVGQFIHPDDIEVNIGSTLQLSSESEDQLGRWESSCGLIKNNQLTVTRQNKCQVEYHDKFGSHQASLNVVKPEKLQYQVTYIGSLMNISFSFPKSHDALSYNVQLQCNIISNKEWFKLVSVKPLECVIEPVLYQYGARMPKYIELDAVATTEYYRIVERINLHFFREIHLPVKKIELSQDNPQDKLIIQYYQKPVYSIDYNILALVTDIYNSTSETMTFEFDSYATELKGSKRIEGRIWFTEKRSEDQSILVIYKPTEIDWYANVVLVAVFTGICISIPSIIGNIDPQILL